MKKNLVRIVSVAALCILMNSCYTFTTTVGDGPKKGVEERRMNHYLIGGLIPIATADISKMAGNTKNYSVTLTHTFLDGILTVITGGIYAPTTVIVKK